MTTRVNKDDDPMGNWPAVERAINAPKWTPGPWFAGTGWIGAGAIRDGNVVARVPNYPYGPSEANAHLIAAAPELYAALEQVLIASEDNGGMNDIDWSGIRAALAKARGEVQS